MDLAIGIAQIALGVFLSWKAFIVSLKDLPSKQRKKHRLIFGMCSLLVFALSAIQTYRNIAFNSKLEKLADKSDQAILGVVAYNLEPLSGLNLSVDYHSKNKSLTGTAQHEREAAKVFAVDTLVEGKDGTDGSQMYGVPASTQDFNFESLLREASHAPETGTDTTYTPNEDTYRTTGGPPITPELTKHIINGDQAVLHIVIYRWKDSVGDEFSAGCGWLQPNSFKPGHGQVWRHCERHNGMFTKEERSLMTSWSVH